MESAGPFNRHEPSAEEVRAQLRKLIEAGALAKGSQIEGLLTYMVEETLAGNTHKEIELAYHAQGDRSYDPASGKVRSTVRRLREKLKIYYAKEGIHDPVLIEVPQAPAGGGYAAAFERRIFPAAAPPVSLGSPAPAPPAAAIPETALPADGVSARRPSLLRLLVALTAVIACAACLWWIAPPRHPGVPGVRRSVAVLTFQNLSSQPGPVSLGSALAEMFTTEIAEGSRLRTIPRGDVAQAEVDLSLKRTAELSANELTLLRQNLGADLIVHGSYMAIGEGAAGQLRLDVRVDDTLSRDAVTAHSENGRRDDLFGIVARVGSQMRKDIGLEPVENPDGLRRSLPSNPEAARLYAQGLERQRAFDPLGASQLLAQAAARAPEFAATHTALASALVALGRDREARLESLTAMQLSAALDRQSYLRAEGLYYRISKQWPQAEENYAALFRFFPDSVEYGLELAGDHMQAGHLQEALETIAALRRLPDPAGKDPRIDGSEALAAAYLNQYRRSAELAHRQAERAKAIGARRLYAKARLLEAGVMADAGYPLSEAQKARDEAREICQSLGDRICVATSWRLTGNYLVNMGDFPGALQAFREVLAIARSVGNVAETGNALNGMAVVYESQGDLVRAEGTYRELLAQASQAAAKYVVQQFQYNLGEDLMEQGRLAEAQPLLEEALRNSREIGATAAAGLALAALGDLMRFEGYLDIAQPKYSEARDLFRLNKGENMTALSLNGLAEVALSRGDTREARKNLESEAREWWLIGANLLARVDLAERRYADAEALARRAVEEFQKQHRRAEQAVALGNLALALAGQQRLKEARAVAGQAAAAARELQETYERMSVAIAVSRVDMADRKWPEAVARLTAVRDESARLGYRGLNQEARSALAEAGHQVAGTREK